MIIRKFKAEDLDAVLELFHDVIHSIGSKYYDSEQTKTWASSSLDKDKWLNSLSTNITFVAEDKGKIIAFGDMTKEGYFDHLYVHKNYQGSGAALKIFRKLEEEARRMGLKEITTEASIMAKPLAERQGFEVIEEQRKIHKGVEFINYVMRKKL